MVASTSPERFVSPAQAAELLAISVREVMRLIYDGQLRGVELGAPPRWRVAEASIAEYIDEQREQARRAALWQESSTASFPEMWGLPASSHHDNR